MKKNQAAKKGMAALLSATMVMSLSACGNSNAPTASTTDETAVAQTQQETVAEVAATTEAAVQEPEYDFGGRVIKIGSYYDMTPNPEDNAISEALSERIAFVEENYNCKIEFVDLGDDYMNDYVTSVLAGDPVVDIGYAITTKVLPALIEGGIAYPISDLNVIDFNEYKWRSDVIDAGYYKGKNYTMLLKDPEIRYGIFWNKTLFEQYGLPDLYQLYEADEWNWDKFKEIAMTANQDTDNDGTIDIYGFNARENLGWCYLYSNDSYVAEKTDAGMKVDLSDPSVVEALTALQDFSTTVDYRKLDWSVDSWDSLIGSFRDGNSMMCLEEFWISYAYLNEMKDDWGWVPFPKGNSASDWSCYGKENGCRIILNGVEDPETVARVYDLITDLADTEADWDDLMEDQLESWSNDATTVENVSYIYNNHIAVINSVNGFSALNNAINSMIDDISAGTTTPQTALETYQSQIDAALADLDDYDYGEEMQSYIITEEEETTQETEAQQ